MKTRILILLGMFMMVSTVEANHGKKSPNNIGYNYTYENSVNFEERGIEFFVFTNGEFDFNTNFNNSNYNNNHRGINRDYKGRIIRIGNSSLSYDSYGNVTRIGNVYMRYYRGQLTDVGNLKVRYDYWGNPTFYGTVKNNYYTYNGFKINLNIGDICSYNDAYFYRNDFRRNYSKIREDKNYYYYRANPNATIGKRSKTLRRRKPVSTTYKNTSSKRRNNTTYRKPANVSTRRITTPVKRVANTTYKRPTTKVTKKIVTPVKRSNTSASKRSTTVKRNIQKATKQKVATVRNRRS